jgi:DNA uptake protein ComE-like DNA-binding protein
VSGAAEREEPSLMQRVAEARRARREEREAKRAAREKEAAERRAARERKDRERAAEKTAARDLKRTGRRAKRERERQPDQPNAEQVSPEPEAAAVPAPKPSKPRSRRKDSGIDVNEATFEQLRGLGLSVTQATRMIAYRERKDGFGSLDDLDTVPGIPKDLLGALKEKLTL